MGYLGEFPHMEANKLNLDWLLEQYSTFNKRIKEILDHFDEVAAEMASEVNQLEQDFDEFKQTVNNNFSNLSHDIEVQVNAAIADIQRQIDTISNNMAAYIEAHMDEWQTEAIEVLFESDDRYFDNNSTITCDKTFAEVFEAIDNANYKFKLAYIYEDSPEVKETVELTNIQRFGDGTSPSDYIIFEGVKDSYILTVKYDQDGTLRCVKPTLIKNVVGNQYQAAAFSSSDLDSDGNIIGETGLTLTNGNTYLIVGDAEIDTPSIGGGDYLRFKLNSGTNIDELIKADVCIADGHTSNQITFTGLYKAKGSTDNKLTCNITINADAPDATNFSALIVHMRAIQIS